MEWTRKQRYGLCIYSQSLVCLLSGVGDTRTYSQATTPLRICWLSSQEMCFFFIRFLFVLFFFFTFLFVANIGVDSTTSPLFEWTDCHAFGNMSSGGEIMELTVYTAPAR